MKQFNAMNVVAFFYLILKSFHEGLITNNSFSNLIPSELTLFTEISILF